jgi:Tfp pilus assembly protein PilV
MRMSRYWALRRRSEDGFTLIESLVACVVLMILSSAVFGILATALRATKTNTHRVGASQLAARELEIWRQKFAFGSDNDRSTVEGTGTHTLAVHDVDGTPLASGSAITVGNVPYTVTTTVTPLVTGVGNSACDGGDIVAHPEYKVTSQVTWANMGVTAPVTNTTVLTPPKSTANDPAVGYLAVKVTDASGSNSVGRVVSISGPAGGTTATTDSSGCAVVSLTAAGSYTATLSQAGYVDFKGQSTSSVSSAVSLGSLTVVKMNYDKAITLNVSFTQPAGYTLPQPLPQITLANTGIQPAGALITSATGPTTAIGSLWPFATGYAVWTGSCSDADPAAAPTNGSRAPATVAAPGSSVAVSVPLQPIDITLENAGGDAIANATVTAAKTSPAPASCATAPDGTLTLGVTDASGHLGALLPNGYWQLSSQGATTNLNVAGAPASISLATS